MYKFISYYLSYIIVFIVIFYLQLPYTNHKYSNLIRNTAYFILNDAIFYENYQIFIFNRSYIFSDFKYWLTFSNLFINNSIIDFSYLTYHKIIIPCIFLFLIGMFAYFKNSNVFINLLIYLELLVLAVFLIFILRSWVLGDPASINYLNALALLVNAAVESVIGCCLLINYYFVLDHILWPGWKSRK